MNPGPRERLITGAIALVRERGVAGTGITELLARSDTARRSVYQNFPGGKGQLIEESTRVAGQAMSAVIADLIKDGDPADTLAAFIAMWKDLLVASDFTAGCPVVAAALGGTEAPMAPAAAAEAFAGWEKLITEHLEGAGVRAAASLATTAVCAIEGAIVVAQAARSVAPLDRVGAHLAELVSLHRG